MPGVGAAAPALDVERRLCSVRHARGTRAEQSALEVLRTRPPCAGSTVLAQTSSTTSAPSAMQRRWPARIRATSTASEDPRTDCSTIAASVCGIAHLGAGPGAAASTTAGLRGIVRTAGFGRLMFLSSAHAESVNAIGSLFATYSRTAAVTMISPGAAKLMDARRYVHPVADQPVAIDDDVFDIDPDAQSSAVIVSDSCHRFLGSPLYFERPTHRRDRARKFHQHRVTRNLEQPDRCARGSWAR